MLIQHLLQHLIPMDWMSIRDLIPGIGQVFHGIYVIYVIPCRELAYPTWGIGKSSTQKYL